MMSVNHNTDTFELKQFRTACIWSMKWKTVKVKSGLKIQHNRGELFIAFIVSTTLDFHILQTVADHIHSAQNLFRGSAVSEEEITAVFPSLSGDNCLLHNYWNSHIQKKNKPPVEISMQHLSKSTKSNICVAFCSNKYFS